uniref:PDZ domain-containing protein n=1 Tax=Haptolina brevifila TaxID=156173 RepID=A0A7S2J4X2_9EUKA|eukprot:CAMPEP_0174734562 /NCGR_PEP_ID=MMETSP1094-20130205/63570_1 /TAXON_ID=156173 /ORGANISM="Chrysochromulina brevifilum, Strain UTEX LB 985" /LENGTH=494 /DNA_ID=CAMNT_0015937403 /DNA_START=52 /DNA_END=1536 /DNA_ORIENTATION=-
MSTTTTIETLELTAERGENGGFGMAIMPGPNGDAYVERVQDKAAEQGIVKAGDRITHVGGEGPFKCREACSKVRAAGKKVTLRVIRGEPPPPPAKPFAWRTAVLVVGISVAMAAMGVLSMAELEAPLNWPEGQELEGQPADGQAPVKRPAMQIGGKPYYLEADGSAIDPDAIRSAIRSDQQMMASMRQDDTEWAAIIAGRPDGTYDINKFQKKMRKNFLTFQRAQATKLKEDGTAEDPVAYLEHALKDKKWVSSIKKMGDEQLKEALLKGEPEALQYMLKDAKMRAEGKAPEDTAPPPPPTPYDDMGQVEMSFRILTDEGEEKDLYSLRAKQTEEEKWELPRHMWCSACEAVAHQGALAVSAALKAMYKGDLVGVTSLEAMQDLCANGGVFTQEYGVVPTKSGMNAFRGPGITEIGEGFEGDTSVMLQTAHSNEWGKKLQVACKEYLEGSEADEDELAAAVMEAEKTDPEGGAPIAFKKLLCQKSCADQQVAWR